MRADQRRVYHLQLRVTAKADGAVAPKVRDIADALLYAEQNSLAYHELENGSLALTIADVGVGTDYCRFLVKASDLKGSDVSFTHRISGAQRDGGKQGDEGRDYGAHVLIKLPKVGEPDYVAKMLLERQTNLSRSMVRSLIQAVLRAVRKHDRAYFQSNHSGGIRVKGVPKKVSFQPYIWLEAEPSDFIANALNGLTIQDIKLVKQRHRSPVQARPWLAESVSELRLVPTALATAKIKLSELKDAMKDKSADYETAIIRFEDPNTGESRKVKMVTSDGTILDDTYIKASTVYSISPPLSECPKAVATHMIDKMKNLL